MTAEGFQCSRCGRSDQPRLERPPMPGSAGRRLVERVCRECWQEWQTMEVMVINELRLNFMDPEAAGILEKQMRDFLQLPEDDAPTS
jgi:Fe-S cluster biosynthesis and repair protein YggX